MTVVIDVSVLCLDATRERRTVCSSVWRKKEKEKEKEKKDEKGRTT
jgi:hypothetical protein